MSEVVIFVGPPCVGKTSYFEKHLRETHVRFSAAERFGKECVGVGLRQIILQVVALLKQEKNVVVDDVNNSSATRRSYISLIRNKVPATKVKCVSFTAKHGMPQLLWSNAMSSAFNTDDCPKTKQASIVDWFSSPLTAAPSSADGFDSVENVSVGLKCFSCCPLELPCLLIDWACLVTTSAAAAGDQTGKCPQVLLPAPSLVEAVESWQRKNVRGRVIIIRHTASSPVSNQSSSEENEMLRSSLLAVCRQTDSPVFCVSTKDSDWHPAHDPSLSSKHYVFAWLQRIHHLNFQHPNSVSIYSTPPDKLLAENIGIRPISLPVLSKHPNIILRSDNRTAAPKLFTFLADYECAPCEEEGDTCRCRMVPSFPPFNEKLSDDGCAEMLGFGQQRHLLACHDHDVLERYKDLYRGNGAAICSEPSSFLEDQMENRMGNVSPVSSEQRQDGSGKKRIIPNWLKRGCNADPPDREGKKKKRPHEGDSCQRVEYVMSGKEFIETAREVLSLKEAGEFFESPKKKSDDDERNSPETSENCEPSDTSKSPDHATTPKWTNIHLNYHPESPNEDKCAAGDVWDDLLFG